MQLPFQYHALYRTVKGLPIKNPLVQIADELKLSQEDVDTISAERAAALKRNKRLAGKERAQGEQEDYPETHKQARRQGAKAGKEEVLNKQMRLLARPGGTLGFPRGHGEQEPLEDELMRQPRLAYEAEQALRRLHP